MTGRDLIIYIMQNGLEDKPVFENGALLGFMTERQFAEKMSVGVASVEVWIERDTTFIPMRYSEWNPLHTLKHQY